MIEFEKGKTYQSKTHGMVEYRGLDCYHGQQTLMFKSKYGTEYWLPATISCRFDDDKTYTEAEHKEAVREVIDRVRSEIAEKLLDGGSVEMDTEYKHITGSEMANVFKGFKIPSSILEEVLGAIRKEYE